MRDREIDLVIIADPYTRLNTQAWVTDATCITAIWSCKNRPIEDQVYITQKGFVRVKLGNVHFYSVYAPPSLKINEFKGLLDRLAMDARKMGISTPGLLNRAARKRTRETTSSYKQCPT